MNRTLTGHPKVDAIAYIKFEGDITPKSWYKHIVYQTSKGETKVDRLAIDILSDVVYWYRPHEKRHEITGESIGWQKKFKGDELHRSVDAFAEVLNTTPRCIRESIKVLERLGLVKAIYKPVYTQYGCLPNVMHIDINPEAIAAITYRPNSPESPEIIEKSLLTKWVTSSDETVSSDYETSKDQLRNEEVNATKSATHPYIEISSEITSEISPPYPPEGGGACEKKTDGFRLEKEEEDEAVAAKVEIATKAEEEIQNKIHSSVETENQTLQTSNSNPGEEKKGAMACDNKDASSMVYANLKVQSSQDETTNILQQEQQEDEAVAVEVEIVTETEEEIQDRIRSSAERENQTIQTSNSNPGEELFAALACDNRAKGQLTHKRRKAKAPKISPEQEQVFLKAYLAEKPSTFTKHSKLLENHLKVLSKLVQDFGDTALEYFVAALIWAREKEDGWWVQPTESFSLQDLLVNDKVPEYAAKHFKSMESNPRYRARVNGEAPSKDKNRFNPLAEGSGREQEQERQRIRQELKKAMRAYKI